MVDYGKLYLVLQIWRQDHICKDGKTKHCIYGQHARLLSNDKRYVDAKVKEWGNILDSRHLVLEVEDSKFLDEPNPHDANSHPYVLLMEWLCAEGHQHFHAVYVSNDIDLVNVEKKEYDPLVTDAMKAVKCHSCDVYWIEHTYLDSLE